MGATGTQIVIGQPISHSINHILSGNRSNIAVKIFGPDLPELRRLTGEIKALVQAVEGAVDVSDEQQGDVPFLTLRFRRDALARHGLSIRQVAETVEMAFSGMAVSRVQQGQATYDLAVRFDPSAKANLDAIRSTLVTTASGARVPLSALADIRNDRAIAHIHHLVEHEGVSNAAEAVKRGAEERLLPILMTALAAGLALVPLALAAGQPGSEIQSPMAIVILFGLGSSTLLNMIVVPALYLRFGTIHKRLGQRPASHLQGKDAT